MFRFLHAADLHLDSPLKGLERYDGAPVEQIRSASRRALENMVRLAIDRDVQAVVIAGDIYDGNWRDANTGLFFIQQMTRLVESGIRVAMIRGNHDAANRMTQSLRLPDGVTLLGTDKAETITWPDWGVAIHGQSFADAAETRNLALEYPAAVSGQFNIGLLHTSLTGSDGHDNYAPCTPEDLRSKGYDYWALGHIHRRDDSSYREPAIVYPGNLQGRHIRETGAKGCVIGQVSNQRLESLEFCEVDVLRWQHLVVNLSDCVDTDEMLQAIDRSLADSLRQQGDRPLAVRVEMTGPCAFHRQLAAGRNHWLQEVRNCGIQVGGERVWIEKVRITTRELGKSVWDNLQDGPLAELWTELDRLKTDDQAWEECLDELQSLEKKLPLELQAKFQDLRAGVDAQRDDFLKQVHALLAGRLSGALKSS